MNNRSSKGLILALIFTGCLTLASAAAENDGGSQNVVAQKHFIEGTKKSSEGDYVGALVNLTEAIAADPKYGRAYGNRGSVRINLHDYKGAISDLDIAQKYCPGVPALAELKTRAEQALHSVDTATEQPSAQQNARNVLLPALIGGDLSDPATIIMMRAQQEGLLNRKSARPAAASPPPAPSGNSPFH